MGNSTAPENIVLGHIIRAVPEREQEIRELWLQYDPKIFIARNKAGITLTEKKRCISFDPKTMDVLWLIGFSGWKAIECYSPHVFCAYSSGQSIEEALQDDAELDEFECMYKQYFAAVKELMSAKDSKSVQWPPGLPCPNEDRDAFDDQYKAAFDLTCLAVAFMFFHEIRHVEFSRDGQRPKDLREEELQCDVWAREFMTVKIASYARTRNHQYQKVLRKRSIGIALAALIIHEITPFWAICGNENYFSIKTRLKSLLDNTPITNENDHFWVFTASLLIGIYRESGTKIDIRESSAKKLANRLLDNLQMD